MQNLLINLKKEIFPISLILILVSSRLIPHPSNFSPILAAAIFSGFYFREFFFSIFIIIFSMFLGDLFLGMHGTMLFTYISLIIAVALGIIIKNLKIYEIIITGLLSSTVFFVVTNFGAWLTLEMYEKTLIGLFNAYILAIPFFHNTLISTLFYLFLIKLLFNFAIKKN